AAFARRTVPSTAVLELLAIPETVRDVRTWPLLEAGLAHPHLRAAASAALIRLGPTIAPRLRERFNRRGDATDAARLEVLVAVERKGTTQLLLDAARRGSAPVRRSALEALATHSALSADAREAVILEVFDASAESSRPELAGALAKLGTRHALRRLWPLVSAGHLAEPHLRSLLPPTHVGRWLSLVEEAVPAPSRGGPAIPLPSSAVWPPRSARGSTIRTRFSPWRPPAWRIPSCWTWGCPRSTDWMPNAPSEPSRRTWTPGSGPTLTPPPPRP